MKKSNTIMIFDYLQFIWDFSAPILEISKKFHLYELSVNLQSNSTNLLHENVSQMPYQEGDISVAKLDLTSRTCQVHLTSRTCQVHLVSLFPPSARYVCLGVLPSYYSSTTLCLKLDCSTDDEKEIDRPATQSSGDLCVFTSIIIMINA